MKYGTVNRATQMRIEAALLEERAAQFRRYGAKEAATACSDRAFDLLFYANQIEREQKSDTVAQSKEAE